MGQGALPWDVRACARDGGGADDSPWMTMMSDAIGGQ